MEHHLIHTLPLKDWNHSLNPDIQAQALHTIEEGRLIFLPQLAFHLHSHEQNLLCPSLVDEKAKNISFDPKTQLLKGAKAPSETLAHLQSLLHRFAHQAHSLIQQLLPHYNHALQQARTSFRPAQITHRKTSYRKDDRLLHVDAFPANPNQGRRILRVFCNINPEGKNRTWRVGEPFETVAQQFLPAIRKPFLGSHTLLHALRITKSRRTEYDHIMLQLHNKMKKNTSYQQHATQTEIHFPPGSTWIVQTDQVSHAALSGQHVLEQTFYLPVEAMGDPNRSPLKILERLTRRSLTT